MFTKVIDDLLLIFKYTRAMTYYWWRIKQEAMLPRIDITFLNTLLTKGKTIHWQQFWCNEI